MFDANTSHAACPVRIMYAESEVDLSAVVHAAWLRSEPDSPASSYSHRTPLAIIRCTEFSDYSGSSVERSNYRVILGDSSRGYRADIVQIIGSHGYMALAYDATLGPVPGDDELHELLDGVDNYPLLDDDDHSVLESELETEAWEDHGRQDFRKALIPVLDALDDDGGAEAGYEHELPDDDAPYALGIVFDANVCSDAETWQIALWDLWHAGCDALNVNGGSGFVVETGSTVHFYIADWCAKAGADVRYPVSLPIHDALRELAKACRSGAE